MCIMSLQEKRVVVFIGAILIAVFPAMNIIIDSFDSAVSWSNMVDVLVLLPSILAGVLLIRVWIKEAQIRKIRKAYGKRMRISGGYVTPNKEV